MTESDWLTSTDLMAMVDFLGDRLDARKTRLFACASARRGWKLLDDQSKVAVEIGERFADGLASAADLLLAFQAANALWASIPDYTASRRAMRRSDQGRAAAKKAAWRARNAANPALSLGQLRYYFFGRTARTNFVHADMLRDLFGPLPFRAVEAAPPWLAWNSGAVSGLTETIDEEGTLDLMPVLGDALEDAGCEEAAILGHLREEGGHVRGCWALDLILGRR